MGSATIALGAIVAPPDAAAATAILRPLNTPRRITVALEGESLLNDASSLLLYRAAVAAVGTVGGLNVLALAPALVASIAGGIMLGPIVARATL